eukprot:gene20207-26231_t
MSETIKLYTDLEFKLGVDNLSKEFLAKNPLGRVPILETSQGVITESNAIARYIARLRPDVGLYGKTFYDSAVIDSWIDYNSHDIELPATLLLYPILGYTAYSEDKTYLVGESISLADITIATTLIYPLKFVLDGEFRKPFVNVIRWFDTLVNQPEFIAVVGTVVYAEVELKAPGVQSTNTSKPAQVQSKEPKEKKEKKAKEPKAEKPKVEKPKDEKPKEEKASKKKAKDDDDDEPEPDYQEKKAEHPFKLLDKTSPSTFVMDTWKKTYSNTDDYRVAMDYFWANFDPSGWSLYRGDYLYNEELKVLFMTSNLIGGFIQRTEEIRKWLFGTMTIRGEEGTFLKVTCYYLIRGDSIQPLIDCNDDAACYQWTKIPVPVSDEDKELVYTYWCSDGPLEGEPNLDSRVYK